jgi:hypothetical protein
MVMPTLPDIGRHPELKMSATKPEVEIPTSGYVGERRQ